MKVGEVCCAANRALVGDFGAHDLTFDGFARYVGTLYSLEVLPGVFALVAHFSAMRE